MTVPKEQPKAAGKPRCFVCDGKHLANHRCAICGRASCQEEREAETERADDYKRMFKDMLKLNGELHAKVKALEAERDAYREVAIKQHPYPERCAGISECVKSIDACVDAKARRIMEERAKKEGQG